MSRLSQLIESMAAAKATLREANSVAKEAKTEHDAVEAELIEFLKTEKLDKASANGYTASRGIETVASVTSWEEFYEYVRENNAFYLLQKRVASSAYREQLQVEGVSPPGTEPMEKDKLSFTKA